MKPAGNKLFLLIKSLNAAEKRHFRRQATLHGKTDLDYLRLFDTLEALSEFSERELKMRLTGASFLRHLPVIKEQLYQRLLDSLHLYYMEQSPEEQVKRRLHQVYILLKRGLEEQAGALLVKLKKQIGRDGLTAYWPEYMDLERAWLEKGFKTGLSSAQLQLWRETYAAHLDSLRIDLEQAWLKSEMARLHVRRVRYTPETADHFRETLLPLSPTGGSGAGKADFQQARSLFFFMQGEKTEAYNSNKALLETLEAFPDNARFIADRYLSTLYNLLIDQLQLGDHAGLSRGLDKLRALRHRSAFKQIKGLNIRIFQWSSQLELNSLIAQRKYAAAFLKAPEIAASLHRLEKDLLPQTVVTLRYLLGLIAFQTRNYGFALAQITPLYQENRPAVAEEIYRYALWLYLLIHYELGNDQLMEHLLVSARRQVAQRRDVLKAERLLLTNLRRLGSAAGEKEKKEIKREWQQEIGILMEDGSERRFFEYLDLEGWLGG
ncbi:MAG TPA: hypothetical protein PKE06_03950 [Flavilitoribacter sp.]|nr:hypothetical protein [Flavilitoribacter sp.]HMQ88373.1 hypothetical protein [Flavilitoribacter sp.]